MQRKRYLTPLTWPAISFAAMILLGTLALCLPVCHGEGASLSVVDAAFLSTSAVCVTGLSPVDISQVLSPVGQGVMLVLIQVGGLGVMTYTSLIFLLWRKQVPFTSREAVSQALLGGDFNMGQFLLQVVCIVLGVELLAALVLFLHDPVFFSPFSALFHAVSAFCNAGFALAPDNMVAFREDGLVCTVICICIVLGGIGFGVLRECLGILSRGRLAPVTRLSRLSRLVINTSLFLIVAGALLIFVVEWRRAGNEDLVGDGLHLFLISLFHSISARTAGFNMVDMANWSHASLMVLMVLMFIGGGPGSCAGGIKIVTFRLLVGYVVAQVRGDRQIVFHKRGVPPENLTRALTLFLLYTLSIFFSVFLLTITENGILHRAELLCVLLGLRLLLGDLRKTRLLLELHGVYVVGSGFGGELARQQIVARVAVGDFFHLALLALSSYVNVENDFHYMILLFGFIQDNRLWPRIFSSRPCSRRSPQTARPPHCGCRRRPPFP